MLSFYNEKDLEVYQNSGNGYIFKESLNDTLQCLNFMVSASGKTLVIEKLLEMIIYELSNNSSPQQVQVIPTSLAIFTVLLSKDENLIAGF